MDPTEGELAEAGDAIMLLISREIWETCQRQARRHGTTPGKVLARALVEYAEKYPDVLQEKRDAAR